MLQVTSLNAISYYERAIDDNKKALSMQIQSSLKSNDGTDKLVAVLTVIYVPSTFVAVMLFLALIRGTNANGSRRT